MTDRPCDGIQVLDLTRLLPGGYATALLADLGADVLKVEQPGQGDYIRSFPPFSQDGQAAYHLALNRGKRSLSVDLSTTDGSAILRDLARRADVLVESFRPGVADRLGVGYSALREVNPGLVYVAITGYGSTGSRAHEAGHDIDYLAHAGVLAGTGPPGQTGQTGRPVEPGPPWPPSVQVADIGGGALPAVVAVLAALRVRDRTGAGQFCDVSMTDGARAWLVLQAAAHALTGELPVPGGDTLSGGLACYRTYRCVDGRHVAVGALEPRFFLALVNTLGVPDLAPWHLDPARQDELAGRLAAVFAGRSRDEWVEVFSGVDACVAPVRDLADALGDEVAAQRGAVDHVTLPGGVPFPVLALAPMLSATPARPGPPPSELGADTDQVLTELGRSAEQIADLRSRGVV